MKRLLLDVSVIRPLIIGFIVIYHAFIMEVGQSLSGSNRLNGMDILQIFLIRFKCQPLFSYRVMFTGTSN